MYNSQNTANLKFPFDGKETQCQNASGCTISDVIQCKIIKRSAIRKRLLSTMYVYDRDFVFTDIHVAFKSDHIAC